MGLSNLEDVLYHEMKDLLSAERQFKAALNKLAKAAEDEDLAATFKEHWEETKEHIARLEQGFKILGKTKKSEKCDAAQGLVAEGTDVIEDSGEAPAKDVMLTAAGRKTEHYEIASYTDAINHAKVLGLPELAELLNQTLQEEKIAAKKLEKIGKRLAKSANK